MTIKLILAHTVSRLLHFLSHSRHFARAAAAISNQCDLAIGYHFAPTAQAQFNGEHWLISAIGPEIKTFVDVGANVGDWTLALLRHSKDASGLAIEPASQALVKLRERLPDAVEIIPAAAGSSDGTSVAFYEEPDAGLRSSAIMTWTTEARQRDVLSVTIDGLLHRSGWEAIDILKIDAEGLDGLVIRGAESALLANKIELVQFEYNRPWRDAGTTLRGVIVFFDSAGYEVYVLGSHGLKRYDYDTFGEFFSYSNFVALRRGSKFSESLGVGGA